MIFGIHISQVKMMSHASIVAPIAAHLSYLPRMNFRVESLFTQYLIIPFEIFDDICNTYISGQEDVLHAKMVAQPLLPQPLLLF